MGDKRLITVDIDEDTLSASTPDAEHERRVAIFDLIEENSFGVIGHNGDAARFSAGLCLTDFMKRISVQQASAQGFAALAPSALRLAEAEGLPAHARAISIRTNQGGEDGG